MDQLSDWLTPDSTYDGSWNLPETETEEASNNTGQWWNNFFGGATNTLNALGGVLNPEIKAETEVKVDMSQMLSIGIGAYILYHLMRK